jgi:Protein of unknown function (DUF1207)
VAAAAPRVTALRAACAAVLVLLAAPGVLAADDAYLAGYATAVIERDLGLKVVRLEVREGVAYVVVESLEDQPKERIAAALTEIEGIERAEVSEGDAEVPGPEPAAEPEAPREGAKEPDAFELLPRVELFDPLIADPRQPHFAAIYQWYLDDPELDHVGSADFGETFALFGGDLWGGRWEIGFLGGTFSVFDLDSSSYDLLNTDFRAGATLSTRRDGFSAQLRLYHQSSHLGDEFLLRSAANRANRINLSYEGVELLLSGDPWPWLRLYGGGGVLVHSDPSDLDRLSAQGGVELKSPVAFLNKAVRPIAAFDYTSREENDWREELSGAAGIQLENPRLSGMQVQILANWFKGNSPNGQFFVRRIETIGIGVHLHF